MTHWHGLDTFIEPQPHHFIGRPGLARWYNEVYYQGTYLDTILPRADLPENQAAMPEIGQRVRLSRGDILQTTALYQCPACGKTYQVPGGGLLLGNISVLWTSSHHHNPLSLSSLSFISLPSVPSSQDLFFSNFRKLQPSSGLPSTALCTPPPPARTRRLSRKETSASGGCWPHTARRSSSTSPASTSRPAQTVSWTI